MDKPKTHPNDSEASILKDLSKITAEKELEMYLARIEGSDALTMNRAWKTETFIGSAYDVLRKFTGVSKELNKKIINFTLLIYSINDRCKDVANAQDNIEEIEAEAEEVNRKLAQEKEKLKNLKSEHEELQFQFTTNKEEFTEILKAAQLVDSDTRKSVFTTLQLSSLAVQLEFEKKTLTAYLNMLRIIVWTDAEEQVYVIHTASKVCSIIEKRYSNTAEEIRTQLDRYMSLMEKLVPIDEAAKEKIRKKLKGMPALMRPGIKNRVTPGREPIERGVFATKSKIEEIISMVISKMF